MNESKTDDLGSMFLKGVYSGKCLAAVPNSSAAFTAPFAITGKALAPAAAIPPIGTGAIYLPVHSATSVGVTPDIFVEEIV